MSKPRSETIRYDSFLSPNESSRSCTGDNCHCNILNFKLSNAQPTRPHYSSPPLANPQAAKIRTTTAYAVIIATAFVFVNVNFNTVGT